MGLPWVPCGSRNFSSLLSTGSSPYVDTWSWVPLGSSPYVNIRNRIPPGSLWFPRLFASFINGFPTICEYMESGSPLVPLGSRGFSPLLSMGSLALVSIWNRVPPGSLWFPRLFAAFIDGFLTICEYMESGSPGFPLVPETFCRFYRRVPYHV